MKKFFKRFSVEGNSSWDYGCVLLPLFILDYDMWPSKRKLELYTGWLFWGMIITYQDESRE